MVSEKIKNRSSGAMACQNLFSQNKMGSANTISRSNMACAKSKNREIRGVVCRNIFLTSQMVSQNFQNRRTKGDEERGRKRKEAEER